MKVISYIQYPDKKNRLSEYCFDINSSEISKIKDVDIRVGVRGYIYGR